MTAPRRESGGQQQAAAEVWQQRASEVLGWDWNVVRTYHDPDDMAAVESVADALAEAARPGQELRERVERLAVEYELTELPADYGSVIAAELRAALEDPR